MAAKLPSLAQLKTSLAKCQGKMAEMLQAITDALTEIEEAKADKRNWTTSSSSSHTAT